jgi:hypothetical protein
MLLFWICFLRRNGETIGHFCNLLRNHNNWSSNNWRKWAKNWPLECLYHSYHIPNLSPRHLDKCALTSFPTMVTRLGEFSPFGRLFSSGSFFEKYRSCPKFRATFIHGKSYIWIITPKLLGPHFGRFGNKLIWSPCSQHTHVCLLWPAILICTFAIILPKTNIVGEVQSWPWDVQIVLLYHCLSWPVVSDFLDFPFLLNYHHYPWS